ARLWRVGTARARAGRCLCVLRRAGRMGGDLRHPAPSQPWAFALTAPPAGITSAVALTSYAVAHDHARNAREVVAAGNRLIAQVPTGYRLGGRLGLGRIAVRKRGGVFFVCVRTAVLEGVR